MDYHKFVYMEGNHHSDTDVAENKNKEKLLFYYLLSRPAVQIYQVKIVKQSKKY